MMIAVHPEGTLAKAELWSLSSAWFFLLVSVFSCVITLFRPVALPQLMQHIHENPEILETLDKMRTDPTAKVKKTKRGTLLGLQMRIIHRSQRGAIYSFFLWLISFATYSFIRF